MQDVEKNEDIPRRDVTPHKDERVVTMGKKSRDDGRHMRQFLSGQFHRPTGVRPIYEGYQSRRSNEEGEVTAVPAEHTFARQFFPKPSSVVHPKPKGGKNSKKPQEWRRYTYRIPLDSSTVYIILVYSIYKGFHKTTRMASIHVSDLKYSNTILKHSKMAFVWL